MQHTPPVNKAIRMPQVPLPKAYEPGQFETQIYQFWEANDCFRASDKNAQGQKAYSIMIPPPNVTGVLHMGHAFLYTIQDILIRWRRMHGDNALWLPGKDHAGIATQTVVERAIAEEGRKQTGKPRTRHDLGRDKFVARAWKWKEDHGNQITTQMRRLGASLDWSRERFTMDEGFNTAVKKVFSTLYHEGLIYRGERIINWCTRCHTALSDLEVNPTDRKGSLWHIAYRVVDNAGKPVLNKDKTPAQLIIATTRPETFLGDTAVAVHPDDERYKHLHGKKAVLPLIEREVPIITDSYVDLEFGTGALKVTPAHDFNDYDLGTKHALPTLSVMGKDGKITSEGGSYAGLSFKDARERIIEDLKNAGLLVKVEEHLNKVGLCSRCETVAEPMISKQWFVKIEPLAKPAIEAVETGKVKFTPKNWEKTYFEWMVNIRDWCISRQLWWGHQIPAWYCQRCSEVVVSEITPQECTGCKAPQSELKQDEDVLDTWFSAALWPFATLGWPENTAPLKTFYPNSVMETGFDIIFFWVARMMMMGIHFMKDVPFHNIYLNAMVRDEKGDKMTKSKGNVIDPLKAIEQYGADSLRFTLTIMAGQGRDVKLSLDRVEGYKAFCNKFWNAVKFFHLHHQSNSDLPEPAGGLEKWVTDNRKDLWIVHRWILSRLQDVTATVEKGLAEFELNVAVQALYDFIWGEFCDWYIEFSKLPLREAGSEQQREALTVLRYMIEVLLRLLHPFVPFMSEELWMSLPWIQPAQTKTRKMLDKDPIYSLMLQPFPKVQPSFKDKEAESVLADLKQVIQALRNFRGENTISPKVEFDVLYSTSAKKTEELVTTYGELLKTMARVKQFQKVEPAKNREKRVAVIPIPELKLEMCVSLEGLVNLDEEVKRIQKELEKIASDISHVENKLSQETFLSKAPKQLVEKETKRRAELTSKKAELENSLMRLKG